MKIVVVGSSNTDMIVKVAHLPKPGETILGGEFTKAAGGKGANQAVAAARSGGKVAFIAKIGDDIFGESALEGFKNDCINVEYILKDQFAPSGVAQIFVSEEDGENCIAVASGANANLSVGDITKFRDVISSSEILLAQLETPIETITEAIKIAKESGAITVLNPAPAQKLPDDLFRNLTLLTPNETEAELLTGVKVVDEKSAREASEKLKIKGVESIIITLGSKGAFIDHDGETYMVSGYEVEVIDTTAAGDVFNGALAASLAERRPFKDAVQFANAAAALSVTKLGAQPSIPAKKEILEFLNT